MANFIVGLNSNTLSKVVATLYGRKNPREKIFKGSMYIESICSYASFDIKKPPLVNLNKPTQDQWKKSINEKGEQMAESANCFTVCVSDLAIGVSGVEAKSVSMDFICIAKSKNNNVEIKALAAVVDMSLLSENDKIIYRYFLIPSTLTAISGAVSAQSIPEINFGGVSLTLTALVESGVLLLYSGSRPSVALPKDEFFVMMGEDLVQTVANNNIRGIIGKSCKSSGSTNLGVGKVWYDCSIKLTDAYVTSASNPSSIRGSISFSPSAGAGFTILFVPVDIGFKGHVTPGKVGINITLSISGQTLRAEIKSLDGFTIVLEPQTIFASVSWPIAQTMVAALSPLAKSLAQGNKFDITQINSQSSNVCGENITITPDQLSIVSYSDMMKIGGNLKIS